MLAGFLRHLSRGSREKLLTRDSYKNSLVREDCGSQGIPARTLLQGTHGTPGGLSGVGGKCLGLVGLGFPAGGR
eukprot:192052-Chlamydomonas_euryale.AAC.1